MPRDHHWVRSVVVLSLSLCALASAQSLPPGFTRDTLAVGITDPMGMALAPDGRIFVCRRGGEITLVDSGGFLQIGVVPNISTSGNGGLLDLAVDPGWPARPYLYGYYASAVPQAKCISRFTINGNVTNSSATNLSVGAEYKILANIPDLTTIHNGGTLRFGPDGMLYCSIGDDFLSQCQAQTLDDVLGKVIRINVASLPTSGSGPPPVAQLIPIGNPFPGPNDYARLVFARGLRNPWRIAIDQANGRLYVGDVGDLLFEEIDEIISGGENFGWPIFEGPAAGMSCPSSSPPFTSAIVEIDRSSIPSGPASIVPLVLYRNQPGAPYNFGPAYEGHLFFTDLYDGHWRRLRPTGGSWGIASPVVGQPSVGNWAEGFGNLFDAELAPDGAVYFLEDSPSNSVGRVRGSSPVLAITGGNPQFANAGTPLLAPLSVRLQDGSGAPLPGITVSFQITAGTGTLSSSTGITDVNGDASTTFTPGLLPSPLAVSASAIGSNAVSFNFTWRGLLVDWQPLTRDITFAVVHSETSSPVTLVIDAPQAMTIQTPVGSIATSILAPASTALIFDGLGLTGPPLPWMTTLPTVPWLTIAASGIPFLGGQTFVIQAYAVHTPLFPALESLLISNAVNVTIN